MKEHAEPSGAPETGLPDASSPSPGVVPAHRRSLFDIHDDILAVERMVEDAGGELTDEIELKLSELQLEAKEKILSVGAWFKTVDMELEGIKLHLKDVQERKKTLENLGQRLRQWIWKGCRMAGIIRGDEKNGWEGDKMENAQLKISWRRSEETVVDEAAPGFEDLTQNFPHFFDYEARPLNEDGGRMLLELQAGGLIELKSTGIRKTVAAEHIEKTKMQISGIKIIKKINPQIK